MKTKILVAVGLWSVIIVVLYYSWFGRDDHYRHLRTHGKKTVGTVKYVGIKAYDIAIVVDGRTYKASKSIPDASFFKSEQYEVFYDENDPKDLTVILSNPVIDLATYDFDTTAPVKVQEAELSQGGLVFWYIVNGQEYRRTQRAADKTDYWKNLQNVWIVYRVGRPEIGYMVRKN